MNRKARLLTAAFGLIMSALSAQAANVIISSLPFTITAPGTYVLTGDLTCPAASGSPREAINIPSTLQGPVDFDLKGFTITGSGGLAIGVSIGGQTSNLYPIIVRNGTFKNFGVGVQAQGSLTTYLHDIIINKIVVFLSPGSADVYSTDVSFVQVS